MKFLTLLCGLMVAMILTFAPHSSFAGSGGGVNEPFVKTIYVKYGGSASNSGTSYDAAKSCAADADLWDIPAGAMITNVYVMIDTAVTGSTDLDIGDDDDPDGFVDGTNELAAALGTPGLYNMNAKVAGAYLRVQTAGATDAADIYVVPRSKYYAAAGKEIKQDITTACTAGKYRVIVTGFRYAP